MDGIPSGSLGPGMQVSGQAPRALLVALEISQVRVGSPAQKKAHLRLEQNGQPGKASLSLIKNVRTGAVPMRALAYHSMVRATSLPVVALCPRVVHHGKLASKGTPLIPTSISPIQWKPGTQMGRPVGGLEKPGLICLRRLARLGDDRGIRPEAARLSGFSNTQLSRHPPEWVVPRASQPLHKGFSSSPQEDIDQQIAPNCAKATDYSTAWFPQGRDWESTTRLPIRTATSRYCDCDAR